MTYFKIPPAVEISLKTTRSIFIYLFTIAQLSTGFCEIPNHLREARQRGRAER